MKTPPRSSRSWCWLLLSCFLLDFWNSPIFYKKWLSAAPSLIGESSAYSQGTSFLLIQLTWLGYVPLTLDSLGGHNASLPKVVCNPYLLRPHFEFFQSSYSQPQVLAHRIHALTPLTPLIPQTLDVSQPGSERCGATSGGGGGGRWFKPSFVAALLAAWLVILVGWVLRMAYYNPHFYWLVVVKIPNIKQPTGAFDHCSGDH